MTDEQMASLRVAAEKATAGPWQQWGVDVVVKDRDGDDLIVAGVGKTAEFRSHPYSVMKGAAIQKNAAYIALANPAAVLALLDRVAAAEASVDAAWRAGRDAAVSVVRASGYVDTSILTIALSMLQPPADMAAAE